MILVEVKEQLLKTKSLEEDKKLIAGKKKAIKLKEKLFFRKQKEKEVLKRLDSISEEDLKKKKKKNNFLDLKPPKINIFKKTKKVKKIPRSISEQFDEGVDIFAEVFAEKKGDFSNASMMTGWTAHAKNQNEALSSSSSYLYQQKELPKGKKLAKKVFRLP